MQVVAIPPEAVQRSGASPGLLVQGVDAAGPARRAGIRPGDVVLEVDGHPVRVPDDLTQLELGLDVGTAVDVVVERSGQRHTVSLTPVPAT
jgi:S1-C subfamily serine protease